MHVTAASMLPSVREPAGDRIQAEIRERGAAAGTTNKAAIAIAAMAATEVIEEREQAGGAPACVWLLGRAEQLTERERVHVAEPRRAWRQQRRGQEVGVELVVAQRPDVDVIAALEGAER